MSTELTTIERAELALAFAETKTQLATMAGNSARIVSITNKAGYDECHGARMALKNTRVEIEKRGKAAREDATAFSKSVIAKEKELIDIIAPEESRLNSIQAAWDAEREAERQAKIDAERERIAAVERERLTLEQAEADRIRAEQQAAMEAQQAELDRQRAVLAAEREAQETAIAEQRRIAAAELAEQERLAAVERKRIADERAELEREQAEQRRIKAEADRVESDRLAKIERDRLDAEAKAAREAETKRLADEAARIRQEQEDAHNNRMSALRDGAPALRIAAIEAVKFLTANGHGNDDVTITLGFAIEQDAATHNKTARRAA